MSENTKCNFCTLKAMRERAARRGVTVMITKDKHGWTAARYSDEHKASASFMVLTDHCVC